MNPEERDALLYDYVDGLLTPEAKADFERELASNPSLRAELEETQQLLQRAAALPTALTPPEDLWRSIEARIQHRTPSVRAFPALRRVIPFPLTALAAAVVAVASLALWNASRTDPVAPPVQQAEAPAAPADTALAEWRQAQSEADAAYERVRAGLLDALAERRESLSPEMAAALRDNLAIVDNAMNEITLALQQDKQNAALLKMLVATREKELTLLERVVNMPLDASADKGLHHEL